MTETVSDRFDVPRLDRVIEQITLHPETWEQGNYRCATGMCVAGHIVEQNGDEWLMKDTRRFIGLDLVLVPEVTPGADAYLAEFYKRDGHVIPDGMLLMAAGTRAAQLLGLTTVDHSLFDGENSLEDIIRYRDMMADGVTPFEEEEDYDDWYMDDDEDEDDE